MQTNINQANIMVIDDRPANLNYLVDILAAQGYKVRVFPDGELALQSAERNPPDLILLDIDMPKLNGFEVCVMLKAHTVLKNIPVIFISALIDSSDKIRAFNCGGVDFISKPFEPEEVKLRIKTHLTLTRTDILETEIRRRLRIEKQYYAQLDNFSDAIIHVDQQGNIVYCNPVTEQYFGYPASEMINKKIELLVPSALHQAHVRHRHNYLTQPTTRRMSEHRTILARKKDGQTFPVNINLSNLYSDKGLLISAEIKDISEQQKLKSDLAQQQQFIDDALGKIGDGIMITNSDGNILMTNPAIQTMLGYRSDELEGKQTSFIFNNETEYFNIQNQLNDTHATQQHISLICHLIRIDRTTLPAEIIVVPVVDNQGQNNGHFHIVRDISERVRMEQENKNLVQQLIQAQKMEALGQLTGGIAHDFNNILASMMGFTELLIDIAKDELEPDQHNVGSRFSDYLHEIQKSGERAQTLIAQMLTFSRQGNNNSLQAFDVRILLNEAIKMLRPVLPSSIKIQAHAADNISQVMADPVQLHQLLMNICINARDAMAGKGSITIDLRNTTIVNSTCTSCHQKISGHYLDLNIRDTGPGIDNKLITRLFEPFFTTKQVGKGTGMGLAMVHGITHRHNGHILVESEATQGSVFHILLPYIPDQETPPKNQSELEETQSVLAPE